MNSSVFIIYHYACMLNLDAWLRTASLDVNQLLTCEEIQRFFFMHTCSSKYPKSKTKTIHLPQVTIADLNLHGKMIHFSLNACLIKFLIHTFCCRSSDVLMMSSCTLRQQQQLCAVCQVMTFAVSPLCLLAAANLYSHHAELVINSHVIACHTISHIWQHAGDVSYYD
mgnify:CR=1 FL=1